MARTPQYERLLAELDAGELSELERKVLDALLKAPNGITRRGLIRVVYGVEAQRNLSNDPHDRKIRKAIESLRNRHDPDRFIIRESRLSPGYQPRSHPEYDRGIEKPHCTLEQRLEEACQFYDLPRSE